MAVFIACLALFLTMTGHSAANYCVCNTGVGDGQLQKNIDYACGAGADCAPILQNGPCFNPNTIRDHCNYAVNSYYQRKGQADGSCSFSNTAAVTQTPPTTSSGCVFPSSPSNAGTSTSTNPSTSPTGTNPTSSPTTTGGSGTGTGGTGTGTTSTTAPGFGLGPSGSGITNTESMGVALQQNLFTSLAATLVLIGLICPRL
ncbi:PLASMODESMATA CALLOSE-BINDING PROTEIN 3 [Coffea eugenioides]|uniref:PLASMODESMATA CALLOSE-BINDING PROTEIN 3 n=1 Tax=Coffea eugenioides TaxID=49369 RepID=UPI000F6068BD|nr:PLASMODESMATA CALLOSE-BINDING PROTEIN 3 [Coffea eugenioides]